MASVVTPPWSDDVFDAPREAFPSPASHLVQSDLPSSETPAFYMASSSSAGDPLAGSGDPWASYGNLTFGVPNRSPFATAQLTPPTAQLAQPSSPFSVPQQRIDTPPAQQSRPPSVNGTAERQRVDPEDELSDSREEEAT